MKTHFSAFLLLIIIILADNYEASNDHHHYNMAPNDFIETARMVTKEYNAMTGPTDDDVLLEHLRNITARAKSFLKLAGHTGNIISTGLEAIIPKPEDPLFKALTILHVELSEKFEHRGPLILDREEERDIMSSKFSPQLGDLSTEVSLRMYSFARTFKVITDPNKPRILWRDDFIRECTDRYSEPQRILEFLNERINILCNTNHPQNQTAMLHIRSKFKDFERKVLLGPIIRWSPEFHEYHNLKIRTIYCFAEKGIEDIIPDLLNNVGSMNQTSSKLLLLQLNNEMSRLLPWGCSKEICLLRSVYETYDLKREPLFEMAKLVLNKTIKLAIIGGFCANISNGGNPTYIMNQIERLGQMVSDILGNMTNWINRELEQVWPDNTVLMVKESLLGIADITNKYQYNITAAKIATEAAKRGVPGFVYQSLVSLEWDNNFNMDYHCNGTNNCVFVKNFRATNFAIMRHQNKTASNQAERAQQWLQDRRATIAEIIHHNDKISNLTSLVALIEKNLSTTLLADDRYGNYIFLHNSKLRSTDCVLNVGLYGSNDGEHPAYSHVEVYKHYWWPTINDEIFKFYLFL